MKTLPWIIIWILLAIGLLLGQWMGGWDGAEVTDRLYWQAVTLAAARCFLWLWGACRKGRN